MIKKRYDKESVNDKNETDYIDFIDFVTLNYYNDVILNMKLLNIEVIFVSYQQKVIVLSNAKVF